MNKKIQGDACVVHTMSDLTNLLAKHEVNTDKWTPECNKATVEELFVEIQHQESVLRETYYGGKVRLVRCMRVVSCHIRTLAKGKKWVLRSVLIHSPRRSYWYPALNRVAAVGGKMKSSDFDLVRAVIRETKEELGIEPKPDALEKTDRRNVLEESSKFPGLLNEKEIVSYMWAIGPMERKKLNFESKKSFIRRIDKQDVFFVWVTEADSKKLI